MSNLLRGAMNLLGGSEAGGARKEEGRLVGHRLDIQGTMVNVRKEIAQGGFATVYSCQETATGAWFALKSQLANDEAAVRAIADELTCLRSLKHPHIVKYVSSAVTRKGGSTSGAKEFLIITELCSGGSVIDLLTAGAPLTLAQVTNIIHGAASAIAYMHAQQPAPITHRDMKVENLLFSSRGAVKLCDFGSATREQHQPDHSWTPAMRTNLEEEFQRATTPMYRAPEILDTYLGYPVGPLQDVWALGCVLFYLCHRAHPFEDSAKLRIIYAKYSIPEDDERYAPFRPLIECALKPDPADRPSAAELQQRIAVLAVALDVRVDTGVPGIDTTRLTGGEPVADTAPRRAAAAAAAPAAGAAAPAAAEGAAAAAAAPSTSTAFSQLRGQGLSMFRNLKEKSAAVMQTVQNTYGSKGPTLVWLTSRIVIAPQMEGVPEALAAQAEESLRMALVATRRQFKMINLATRRLHCEYPEAVADVAFPAEAMGGVAPSMDALLSVAHAAGIYLRQAPAEAFVVLVGSEAHASLAAVGLLVYHRLLPKPYAAIEFLQEKRGAAMQLPPSAHRLLDGLHRSVQPGFGKTASSTRLQLESLVVEHLPAFNNNRSGSRPLVMVYVGGTALWTPAAYETLRAYEGAAERARVQFGLAKSPVAGEVCVVLYHARMSSLTQRMSLIPMFSFGLHTALQQAQPGETSLVVRKGDLDYAPAEEPFLPEEIRVTLHYSQCGGAPPPAALLPGAPRGLFDYPADIVAARHVVGSAAELAEIRSAFGGAGEGATAPAARSQQPAAAPAAAPPPAAAPAPATTDFFGSLSWEGGAAAAPAAAAAAAAAPPPPPPHRTASLVNDREGFKMESLSLDETPILGGATSPNNRSLAEALREEEEEVDLLGIGASSKAAAAAAAARPAAAGRNDNLLFDPFEMAAPSGAKAAGPQTLDDLFGGPPLASSSSNSLNQQRDLDDLLGLGGGGGSGSIMGGDKSRNGGGDLLGDFMGGGAASGSSMHRNASAPSFNAQQQGKPAAAAAFDPFADFLAANPAPSSGASTRSNTPSMRPNYSRSAFDALNPPAAANPTGMPAKPKSSANAFDDLLQSQGFSASGGGAGGGGGGAGGRTMGDMRRAEDIKDLTPEQIKIRDWTAGKERNIRALLASLSEVLWADAPRWEQPGMAQLLTANEVKKSFRRAAIVVHPDKQTGLPHAELAKAIMIELNDAWNAFEESGSPSLA